MKLIICTKRDLAGALILNYLLPRLQHCTIKVLLSDKTRPTEKQVSELADMKFLERDLPMDTLFPLVDADGGDDAPQATFNGLVRRYGVSIEQIADINDAAAVQMISDFAPDLILSARFSLIFKSHVFDLPRYGTWNVHPGALPRYAGLFAPFRCMLEGQDKIGCSLHRVDTGVDTGPLLGVGWLPIDRSKSMLWHVVNTYQPGLELFMDMFHALQAGTMPKPQIQDRSLRVYASLPGAAAFDEFRAKGLRLYDVREYLELARLFLPAASADRHQITLAAALNKLGAPCCCGRG